MHRGSSSCKKAMRWMIMQVVVGWDLFSFFLFFWSSLGKIGDVIDSLCSRVEPYMHIRHWKSRRRKASHPLLCKFRGARHFLKSRTPCLIKSEIKPVKSVFPCKLKRFSRKLTATWAEIIWNKPGNQNWNHEISPSVGPLGKFSTPLLNPGFAPAA